MSWYIGQAVVAIRNHQKGRFKKGDDFSIKGLKQAECRCFGSVKIDIGLYSVGPLSHCPTCNTTYPYDGLFAWFNSHNFAPLDVNISELTEILARPHIQTLTTEEILQAQRLLKSVHI